MVEAGNPEANLSNIQFPFGRPGQRLSSDERKRVKGIPPHALERIEAIRAEFSADLNFVNLMSNQDKHRLLLPVAVRQVPVKLTIDHASNTGSIDVDIAGAMDVWTREIHDGDVIEMPKVGLMLGTGLLIEDQPMPFPLKDLERLNLSVQKAFMAMALIERNAPVFNVAEI